MADLVADLLSTARAGVRVTLESNVTPAVTVFGGDEGQGSSPGALSVLGIRAGLVVRNARGDVLARIGEPSQFEPWRAALFALTITGVAILGVIVIRRAGR